MHYVVYTGCVLALACNVAHVRISDRADADVVADRSGRAGGAVIVDVSSFDAKPREPRAFSGGDAAIGSAAQSERQPSADDDGGVLPGAGSDDDVSGVDTRDSTEGQLCVFGPTVIGIELDGECAFPPLGSYSLTCGELRCEQGLDVELSLLYGAALATAGEFVDGRGGEYLRIYGVRGMGS